MRKTAILGLLALSCKLGVKARVSGEAHEMSFAPGPTVSAKATMANVNMGPSGDSLAHMRVRGGLDPDSSSGIYRIIGAEAEILVPKSVPLSLEANMATVEGVPPDSATVDISLASAKLRDWVSGKMNLFMADGSVALSGRARGFSGFVKWASLEIEVPKGLSVNLQLDTSGVGLEVDEGVLSPQGIPVRIRARGASIEIRRVEGESD